MNTLSLARVPSPLGEILLVWNEAEELAALDFATHEERMRALLSARHKGEVAPLRDVKRPPAPITRAIAAFFAGDLYALDALRTDAAGTEFERRVWEALRRIPAGTTMSYRDLAVAIGRPNACRAVGRANGRNPIGIVVPCHRVIGSGGALTGYAGGIERKRWLLDHERTHVARQDGCRMQVTS